MWEQFSATLMATSNGLLTVSEIVDGLTVILSGHHDLLVRITHFYPLDLRMNVQNSIMGDYDRAWYNETSKS